MQATAVTLLLVASSTLGQYNRRIVYYQPQPQPAYFQQLAGHGAIKKDELEYQQQAFKQWWGDELVLKLDDLPAEGKVPDERIPYAGHDYPDRMGGTLNALVKYDRAFHGGRMLATQHEQRDIHEHREVGSKPQFVATGRWGRMRMVRQAVPTWYGHCNGWTAAAIRHAEPQKSVVRNGVVFTPADIKGLLAELYMYTESEFLGGVDPVINPAVLHITLGNWLGRGSYPLGMETAIGDTVINFPLFSYKATINKFAPRQAEVRNIITYAVNTPQEYDKQPPKYHRQLYFHYVLDLDAEGKITGGRFYTDSGQIDMLWVPLKPAQGGDERNERGNPHLSVREVLALWRESVPEDLRKRWLNVDPTEEDRVLSEEELRAIAEREAPPMPPAPTAEDIARAEGDAHAEGAAPVPAAAAPDSEPASDTATPPSADAASPPATAAPAAEEAPPAAQPTPAPQPAPATPPAPAAEPSAEEAAPPEPVVAP